MKIKTSKDCNIFIQNAVNSHSEYWKKLDTAEDHIMRYKKPFDEEEIIKEGRSWQSNWNFGKGRAITEQSVIDSVNDIYGLIGMMDVEFNEFDPKKHKKAVYQFLSNGILKRKVARSIANAFADAVEKDKRSHFFFSKIEYNSFLFGYCPIIRDKYSYLGYPVSIKDVAFEDRTSPYKITNFVVFDLMKGEMLFAIIDSLSGSNAVEKEYDGEIVSVYESGWILDGIREIIYNRLTNNKELKEDVKNGKIKIDCEKELVINTWEDVELIRQNKGDLWMQFNVNNINIAKIYTTETDGTITETYIATNQRDAMNPYSCNTNKYILFQKNYGQRYSIDDFINLIKDFCISEDDYIQSLRGSSKQIAEDSLRYDLKKNAIEDKLLITGNLLLSSPDNLTGENVKLKVFGGYSLLPEGVSVIPNQMRQDLEDHVNSIQIDESEFRDRMFHNKPRIELSNRPTKDEVAVVNQQYQFSKKSKFYFKIVDYSCLFTSMLKDLVNLDFDTSSADEKIKKKLFSYISQDLDGFKITNNDISLILKEVCSVYLYPINNNVDAINKAMQLVQNPEGRNILVKSLLYTIGFNRDDVNIFIKEAEVGHEAEIASIENASFYNTSEIVYHDGQDHITHLNLHFPKIDRILNGVQKGEDPVKAFNYITNALVNTKRHVEEGIKQSYFFKNRYSQLNTIQKYFEGKARKLAEIIEEIKQEARTGKERNGNSLTPEESKKLELMELQVIKKLERSAVLTKAAMERNQAIFEQKLRIQEESAKATISMKRNFEELKKELALLKESVKLANEQPAESII